ncbi:hypothetical protein RCL1_008662 [Eukaryota sp. TZLM3-RCL]
MLEYVPFNTSAISKVKLPSLPKTPRSSSHCRLYDRTRFSRHLRVPTPDGTDNQQQSTQVPPPINTPRFIPQSSLSVHASSSLSCEPPPKKEPFVPKPVFSTHQLETLLKIPPDCPSNTCTNIPSIPCLDLNNLRSVKIVDLNSSLIDSYPSYPPWTRFATSRHLKTAHTCKSVALHNVFTPPPTVRGSSRSSRMRVASSPLDFKEYQSSARRAASVERNTVVPKERPKNCYWMTSRY